MSHDPARDEMQQGIQPPWVCWGSGRRENLHHGRWQQCSSGPEAIRKQCCKEVVVRPEKTWASGGRGSRMITERAGSVDL